MRVSVVWRTWAHERLSVTGLHAPQVRQLDRLSAVFLDTLARSDCGMAAALHKSAVKADRSWDKPWGAGHGRRAGSASSHMSGPGAGRKGGFSPA
jgi:hypothetical protein